MYSFTVEICCDEGDPLDRSFACMVKSDRQVELVRSMRVRPDVAFGSILLAIDRLALAWAVPQLNLDKSESLHDRWDEAERILGDPFPI